MKRIRLQTKFFENEKDLNEFLKTLEIMGNDSLPKLQNITYIPKPMANGTSDNFEFQGNIMAIVQYITEVEEC